MGREQEERVLDLLKRAYRLADLDEPTHFIWVNSPAAGHLLRVLLSELSLPEDQIRHLAILRIQPSVEENAKKALLLEIRRVLRANGPEFPLRLQTRGAHELDAAVLSENAFVQTVRPEGSNLYSNDIASRRLRAVRDDIVLRFSKRSFHSVYSKIYSLVRELWSSERSSSGSDLPLDVEDINSSLGIKLFLAACVDSLSSEEDFFESQRKFGSVSEAIVPAPELGFPRIGKNCSKRVRELHTALSGLGVEQCFYWMFPDTVIISRNASRLHLDDFHRVHNPDGTAVSYEDGWKLWSWHGVSVPQSVIESSHETTVSDIESEENVEVRRVMMSIYGEERFLLDSGATVVHEDEFGTLYRKEWDNEDDEPLVMVRVKNSTAELDGTFKTYFLRVPPELPTARAAVAWTFGLNSADYAPAKET